MKTISVENNLMKLKKNLLWKRLNLETNKPKTTEINRTIFHEVLWKMLLNLRYEHLIKHLCDSYDKRDEFCTDFLTFKKDEKEK